MGYYVKGFGQQPLNLIVSKTNYPEVDTSPSPREAIEDAINYCQHTLNDWAKDQTPHGQKITQEMTSALQQLNQLLNQYP